MIGEAATALKAGRFPRFFGVLSSLLRGLRAAEGALSRDGRMSRDQGGTMRSDIAKGLCRLLLAGALVQGGTGVADDWDEATDADNGNATDNTPAHGAEQVHDLGALPGPVADQDWYRVLVRPLSSYQFVVDGMTGDLDLTASDVQRLDEAGSFVIPSVPSDAGGVLSLGWIVGAVPPAIHFVRVQGASCGTACTAADRYRARFYDTTYTVPRFNNSGTQTTVLLVQNATATSCAAQFAFLDALGAAIDTAGGASLAPRQLAVVDTSALAPGQSGSIRVRHTCGYGGLSGKAVSVEPSTGFTFDTPLLHRPH
jgi:hypothetical protein